ncbi:MAG: SlyX family protein [Proteobacteria bacterium]|nr:SlyX family protein [Pseudomonadota bacterium]
MDDTIITLQTIVAHQGEDIAALSQELYTQQKELALLKQQMGVLLERLRTLADAGPQDKAQEPPPPHY